ncbi:uncharacterized protein BO95DRAFT_15173 [Aspergillus brunneoviolaceus CBS 621.78]|uniref:Uncharacterized protein n=1 Tax=Aspergillus brunneoviolaceus CBS 621.78 TaxID=1450534 RepID=A0ACD1GJC1_9EURO|nr:hypothetical protein BO95DRAFT_15173 [Aspergillus brunneoviolaceus CBS 621.78]RAH49361.1 hypothetical protein BO95DRAFT_15173 [Aspergillus brunneoviolaceus CBS 621.78]
MKGQRGERSDLYVTGMGVFVVGQISLCVPYAPSEHVGRVSLSVSFRKGRGDISLKWRLARGQNDGSGGLHAALH